MNKIAEIVINLLTLGIPAIIKAIQEGGKGADEFWFKPDKKGRCKFAKNGKCMYSCHCIEDEDSCKKMHCNHEG